MLIGGYAVALYGYVRATNDIDVWIESTEENAKRTESAVREFGFDVPELTSAQLTTPGKITRMGHPPMRIEILNEISGVVFSEANADKIEIEIGTIRVPVIGLKSLIANKLASGRTKDLADAEELSRTVTS